MVTPSSIPSAIISAPARASRAIVELDAIDIFMEDILSDDMKDKGDVAQEESDEYFAGMLEKVAEV